MQRESAGRGKEPTTHILCAQPRQSSRGNQEAAEAPSGEPHTERPRATPRRRQRLCPGPDLGGARASQGLGGEGRGSDPNGYGVSSGGDRNRLERDRWWLHITVNAPNATELSTLKWLMLHECHLNKNTKGKLIPNCLHASKCQQKYAWTGTRAKLH